MLKYAYVFSAITVFIFELVFIEICTRQLGVCSHCYHLLNVDVCVCVCVCVYAL